MDRVRNTALKFLPDIATDIYVIVFDIESRYQLEMYGTAAWKTKTFFKNSFITLEHVFYS